MADFADIASILTTHFGDNVETPESLSVEYPNMEFSKPASGIWARVEINWSDSQAFEFGANPTAMTTGMLAVTFVTPALLGFNEGLRLAGVMDVSFSGTTIGGAGGVRTLKTKVTTQFRDGDEWRVVAVCPFRAYSLT